MIETQEKTIVSLLNAVREQHDQLNNQKIKIKNLEDKVDTCLQVSAYSAQHAIISNPKGYLIYVFLNCRLKYTLLQISYDSYQDTVDKATYTDSSDLFDYLAGNSSLDTNGETISSVSCPVIPSLNTAKLWDNW